MITEQDINRLASATGCHDHLANLAEALGLDVQADSDDNELSWVALPGDGSRDYGDRIIAKIVGDAEAHVEMTCLMSLPADGLADQMKRLRDSLVDVAVSVGLVLLLPLAKMFTRISGEDEQ